MEGWEFLVTQTHRGKEHWRGHERFQPTDLRRKHHELAWVLPASFPQRVWGGMKLVRLGGDNTVLGWHA